MTDKIEEPDELEKLLADSLEPKGDLPSPQLDLEAFGMQSGAKTLPDGRDNRGPGGKDGK